MQVIRFAARGALVALALAACATGGVTPPPSSTATTLMYGWERHFTVEWAAAPGPGGGHRVDGYVYNRNGETALTLRVLAQALDASGAIVGQRIEPVPGGVGGFGRAYFVVGHLPAASSYRVSVWDYTWFQAPGGDRN